MKKAKSSISMVARSILAEELNFKLTERVKELNCLYGISKLIENGNRPLQDVLQGAVNLIPAAWQYPEITCARIKMQKCAFVSPGFRATRWKQSEIIFINGKPAGKLEVFYLSTKPERDEGPFLREERDLIHALAERLGHIVERKFADDRLKQLYENERHLGEKLQTEIRSKIDFTRRLIHELKTPLTSLIATSQLLHDQNQNRKTAELAGYILESAYKMNNRINELHDFIKGEIGQLEIKQQETNLNKIIKSISNEVKALAQKNNMRVEIKVDKDLPAVAGDSERIYQVLLNLLNNAFKHASSGSKVTIKSKTDSSYVTIEVRDYGKGINKEEKKLIFEPYYRSSNKREHEPGLGIGLALCKVLLESMRGKIWLRSETGKGASFYFKLPIYEKIKQK